MVILFSDIQQDLNLQLDGMQTTSGICLYRWVSESALLVMFSSSHWGWMSNAFWITHLSRKLLFRYPCCNSPPDFLLQPVMETKPQLLLLRSPSSHSGFSHWISWRFCSHAPGLESCHTPSFFHSHPGFLLCSSITKSASKGFSRISSKAGQC